MAVRFRPPRCWALLMADSMSFLGYFNFKNIPFYLIVCSIFSVNLILHSPDTFFFCIYIYHQFMLIFFAFDNDDMESSKRRVIFLWLSFLLKCMSKSVIINNNSNYINNNNSGAPRAARSAVRVRSPIVKEMW